jgi:hypothetical protein
MDWDRRGGSQTPNPEPALDAVSCRGAVVGFFTYYPFAGSPETDLEEAAGAAGAGDIGGLNSKLPLQLGNLPRRNASMVWPERRKAQPKSAQFAPVRFECVWRKVIGCEQGHRFPPN